MSTNFLSRQLLSTSNCDDALTDTQCDAVIYTRTTIAIFAIFGCFLIISMIILFRTYHNFSQRLILNLTIAALLDTVPYFFGHQPKGPVCTFQAFAMTWFDWSVLLWVCCITFNLGVNVLRRKPGEKYEKYYHFIAWILPLGIALVPLLMGAYGPAGVWCWIDDDRADTTALRFGIWYGPLFFLILLLFISNGYIFSRVNREVRQYSGLYSQGVEAEKRFLLTQVQPLKYYPVVYLLLSVFPLVNRIQNAADPTQPVFALLLLHSMTSPLQSFMNALVYLANTDKAIWSQCTRAGIARALRLWGAERITERPGMEQLSGDSDTDDEANDTDSNTSRTPFNDTLQSIDSTA
eukprot:m.17027 g.17027  ORF g.17027 m.17027 type:complete len:350 (+) comp11117_c0_seq4:237-1286(+)